MTRADYADWLRFLGHFEGAVTPTRRGRWIGSCQCGYRSASRVNEREAIGAVQHHRALVVKQARRDGVSLPPAEPAA